MKKIILSLFLICGMASSGLAQEFKYSFGLKGGINYTMGGQITGNSSGGAISPHTGEEYWSGTAQAQSKIGYHGGGFFQANIGRFFARPEITYTSIETGYEFPGENTTHSVEKFDIPFLIGYNVFGPLDIYVGPVYSNIIDSHIIDDGEPQNVVTQNSPLNLQAGAKFEFGRFGIDFRYERIMSPAEPHELNFVDRVHYVNKAVFDDPRINQIIMSVTFKLGGSDVGGGGARRRGPCY